MKARNKNKAEKDYDEAELNKAKNKALTVAIEFADTFFDCDGKVFFDQAIDFRDAIWGYEHELKISKARKVAPEWDLAKGIVGHWRYDRG